MLHIISVFIETIGGLIQMIFSFAVFLFNSFEVCFLSYTSIFLVSVVVCLAICGCTYHFVSIFWLIWFQVSTRLSELEATLDAGIRHRNKGLSSIGSHLSKWTLLVSSWFKSQFLSLSNFKSKFITIVSMPEKHWIDEFRVFLFLTSKTFFHGFSRSEKRKLCTIH